MFDVTHSQVVQLQDGLAQLGSELTMFNLLPLTEDTLRGMVLGRHNINDPNFLRYAVGVPLTEIKPEQRDFLLAFAEKQDEPIEFDSGKLGPRRGGISLDDEASEKVLEVQRRLNIANSEMQRIYNVRFGRSANRFGFYAQLGPADKPRFEQLHFDGVGIQEITRIGALPMGIISKKVLYDPDPKTQGLINDAIDSDFGKVTTAQLWDSHAIEPTNLDQSYMILGKMDINSATNKRRDMRATPHCSHPIKKDEGPVRTGFLNWTATGLGLGST